MMKPILASGMRLAAIGSVLTAMVLLAVPTPATAQDYEIFAVRYGTLEAFPLTSLLPDAPEGQVLDVAMAFWVIRGDDRTVLFDTGFFREEWLERFRIRGFVRPDRALARLGIEPEQVTDIIVSHAHWDHMGGIALFPQATLWIQSEEYGYYTDTAWQPGGRNGGIDRADVDELIRRNAAGHVRLIEGDGVEILPGITAFTGARHTYASQYVRVETGVESELTFVLASDNAYLYVNLTDGRASATFSPEDHQANLAAVKRMIDLAGDPDRVIPGHDALQFARFPEVAEGVVRITGPR